jgi:hypothetical protein
MKTVGPNDLTTLSEARDTTESTRGGRLSRSLRPRPLQDQAPDYQCEGECDKGQAKRSGYTDPLAQPHRSRHRRSRSTRCQTRRPVLPVQTRAAVEQAATVALADAHADRWVTAAVTETSRAVRPYVRQRVVPTWTATVRGP